MAHLMGRDADLLVAAGQASVVLFGNSTTARLVELLQVGTTPLDEASAALALLCEAGQYKSVVQYGSPLLKAASSVAQSSLPSLPGVPAKQHPAQPAASPLIADIAMSVAIAHISLAAADGGPTGGLDASYGHLEAALQTLSRHAAAEALQTEVAHCLQGVAVAYAEELLRSAPPAAAATVEKAAGGAGSGAATSAAVAARRAKAISALRGALWRTSSAGSSTTTAPSQPQMQQAPPAAAVGQGQGAGGSAVARVWPPLLTAEERCELMTPLRGLLTASEHVSLYGAVAEGTRPYAAVPLSDQELYDLAVAHLALGVSSGWPHHVLQALSYFERVAKQQHPSAAAADVSFERSVCEALLGREGSGADAAASSTDGGDALGGEAAAAAVAAAAWDSWGDEESSEALLRRLEAQLSAAYDAAAGHGGATAADGGVTSSLGFSVDERGAMTSDGEDAPAAAGDAGGAVKADAGPRADRKRTAADSDLAKRYGWAASWLELSVLPCFPETAAQAHAGGVSLARWFADPRVVVFNKLLAVRSSEAQVTAALGSAVAHVSDASRARLWQLWQAAAQAVGAAAAAAPLPRSQATAALEQAPPASESSAEIGAAPLARGLLEQSKAALHDVGPRAAAAASAVAAAAAAVGNAAADSPRAVAAAARRMVPFGIMGQRWGATPAAADPAARLPAPRASGQEAALEAALASAGVGKGVEERAQLSVDGGGSNVVPFVGSSIAASSGVANQQPAMQVAAATAASGAVDHVKLAAAIPPSMVPAAAGLDADAKPIGADPVGASDIGAKSDALWESDEAGHIHPRMTAHIVVQKVSAAKKAAVTGAASVKDQVTARASAALSEWEAMDEATMKEAVRRVATVGAQALCLGALAAYVGHRVVTNSGLGQLPAVGSGGFPGTATDGSGASATAAARAVGMWLRSVVAAAPAASPAGGGAGGAGHELLELPLAGGGAASMQAISRLSAAVASSPGALDAESAGALLRGWAAARAAAPGLADPRDRAALLGALAGGRAVRQARAQADRDARLGRRVELVGVEAEVEDLRRGGGGSGDVLVTARLDTYGLELNRAAPQAAAFRSATRVFATFRWQETAEGQAQAGGGATGAWRLVDVRDAPPEV